MMMSSFSLGGGSIPFSMVDDTHASKAMKFFVPHPMWLLQHDDNDNDDNSNRQWGSSSTGGSDVGKYLIYEGDYHNAQQLLMALKRDRIPSTNPGAEPPRAVRDSGSARSHSMHLETSSSDRL